MRSRAVSTTLNSTEPSCTSVTAECSVWVWPRSICNCSRASSRLAGLVKRLRPERQRLIGADHKSRRGLVRDRARLFPGQQQGQFVGIAIGSERALDRTLVDRSRDDLDRNTGGTQHIAARETSGREHQRRRSGPERHQRPGARRFSDRSCNTAAAVSSIERRDTSINGQLCRAHSLREKLISSATACLSI